MWTTFAAGCVTSSLFVTACAPNFLAIEFIDKIVHVHISYLQWMKASPPFALPLLLALPLLAYVLYPPEIKRSAEVTTWPGSELHKMGAISTREIILAVLVIDAIVLWVTGSSFIDPTLTGLVGIALMLICGVVSWEDMAKDHSAWTTLVLLATLVTVGRWAVALRVRQVVRRIRRGACRRLLADADPRAAGRCVLLLALHVREPHRTRR